MPNLVLALSKKDRLDDTGDRTSVLPEHVVAIWRLLRRLGVSDSEVDDATQEVFLVVAERRAVVPPEKERSFAYGVALRVARAAQRPPPHRSVELDEELYIADGTPELDELVDQREARRLLDSLLQQMPFELRAVLVLFEIEDLSTNEIALALEIPGGTAASRLRRAREDFQARVARLHARLTRGGRTP